MLLFKLSLWKSQYSTEVIVQYYAPRRVHVGRTAFEELTLLVTAMKLG